MLKIARCTLALGHSTLVVRDPMNGVHSNAVLVPGYWGLFDHGRRLITSSAYFRGPIPTLQNSAYVLGDKWPAQIEQAPEGNYLYLGPIHSHYGHFLISTFSRLWPISLKNSEGLKLVTPSTVDINAHPYMVGCLATLGLSKSNIYVIDRPTRFDRIVVAAPALEEQSFVHSAYRHLFDRAARTLLAGSSPFTSSQPCYLAKFALKGGVGQIVNEDVVANRLAKSGVDIIFPEQMALADQIMLFRDRDAIAGIIGSAFHTASFTRRSRMMMLAYGSAILSNQVLIDRLRHHDAHYVYAREGLTKVERTGFSSAWAFQDPESVADDFLRIFDTFCKPGEFYDGTLPPVGPIAESKRNIAIGCPTRQSSVSEYSLPPFTTEGSRGAVSGFCTGSFQFHTALEVRPWWDVDLGEPRLIHEVRLYNSLVGCTHRASKFAIKLSFDGETWTEAFSKTDELEFGGIDGHPFSWVPKEPVWSRFVRIVLLQRTYFHLDQVAVFANAA